MTPRPDPSGTSSRRRPVRSASTCVASPCSRSRTSGICAPRVNYDVLRRWLLHTGLRGHLHPQHHRRRRQDPRSRRSEQGGRSGRSRTRTSWCSTPTTAALNVLPPTYEPLATGHITEMHELIAELIERGHAYPVGRAAPATSTSTCRRYRRVRRSLRAEARRHAVRRATAASAASATPATSPCGRASRPTSRPTPPGRRRGAAAGRAGTSSARRWPGATSAPSSTSTAAGST